MNSFILCNASELTSHTVMYSDATVEYLVLIKSFWIEKIH